MVNSHVESENETNFWVFKSKNEIENDIYIRQSIYTTSVYSQKMTENFTNESKLNGLWQNQASQVSEKLVP